MLEWSTEYLTGIDLIDKQHKTLIEIANRLYALLKNRLIEDKYDAIVELLNELRDYTIFHFSAEEEIMERIGYRRILSHKVSHNDFVEKIKSIDLSKIDNDQNTYLLDLTDFVFSWITEHIIKTDKRILAESMHPEKL